MDDDSDSDSSGSDSDFDSDSDSDSDYDSDSKIALLDLVLQQSIWVIVSNTDSDSDSDLMAKMSQALIHTFPYFTVGEEELDKYDESVRRFTLSVKVNKVSGGLIFQKKRPKFAGIKPR